MNKKNAGRLDSLLRSNAARLGPVFADPDAYRLQIIYTQIDRDARNRPVFTDFYFRGRPGEYFYPASTVKMPAALLALEKMNALGLNIHTPMFTDSLPGITPAAVTDSTAQNGLPSVAQYIKKIFLVSDNDAFNRLYEFLGQEGFNRALWAKGYPAAQVRHRLDIALPPDANRHTNAVRFMNGATVVYDQPAQVSRLEFTARHDTLGRAHYAGDRLVEAPFDFSAKNRLLLKDMHRMLRSIIFPESVTSGQRFRLKEDDYRFLYRYMSQLPTETTFPEYDTGEFHRNYVKYLMGGADAATRLPAGLRIFNKPGWAYGFLTDVAYFADFANGVEFMLSATLYANKDGIIGDSQYDYETAGKPFLKELGWVIYEAELQRVKKYKPDLERFKTAYEKEQQP